MYTIYEEDKYSLSFLNLIEEFGTLGYSVDELSFIIKPSFENNSKYDEVINEIKTSGTLLNRHYNHGLNSCEFEKDRILDNYDVDTNMAEQFAISNRNEKRMAVKIKELYGL